MIVINICIIVSNTHENKRLNLPVRGVASQILELLPSYEKNEHIDIFLVTKYSEYSPNTNKIEVIKIHKFKNRKLDEIYFFFKSFVKIFQIHKKKYIDIINIHSYYYNLINPFILRIFYKIPLLITTPGDFTTHQREEFMLNPQSLFMRMFYYGWMQFFRKILIRQKKIFIQAINDKIFKSFIDLGFPKTNIRKIPNGISSKSFMNVKEVLEKESNFGYVGRLLKSKNIRFLIRSFKNYLSYYPKDKLYIFGKGPEDEFLLKFIKRNKLENNIFFLGFEKNKNKIYSKFDVLIHPTLGEGVPMTILEAIISDTFIIASNVSGIKDIIKHKKSGLLFNPFDENDLIDQLRYYKENKKLIKNIKDIAKDNILQHYDIDVVTHQIYEFLKSKLNLHK